MLRKKQLLTQQNNLIIPKVTSEQIMHTRNAKVTVQYIQEQQQLIQKPEQSKNDMIHEHTTSQDDLEIENVEYLEENPTAEEFIEEPIEKTEFEDTFYPNAIHCLLDLYKVKYESFSLDDVESIKVSHLWHDIAKDMQESYFEFNEEQVRHKYILLREQYFDLHSREDIEKFDYFEQLHDIYKDSVKDNILKGLIVKDKISVYYKDEVLLNPLHIENNGNQCHDFKSEEIVHKEHEFIDMVEKELQAMEVGVPNKEGNEEIINSNDEIINQHTEEIEEKIKIESLKTNKLKRNFTADLNTEGPPKRKTKLNEYFEINEIAHSSPEDTTSHVNNKLSLFQYNEQQERRHREKMDLLEKSLNLQKHAIEQQNQLLQELIKRLPTS